jgi:hypothetical protein
VIRLLPFQEKKKRWCAAIRTIHRPRCFWFETPSSALVPAGRATFFARWCRDPDPSVLLNTRVMPLGVLLARRLFADAFPGDGRLQLASLDHLRWRSQC